MPSRRSGRRPLQFMKLLQIRSDYRFPRGFFPDPAGVLPTIGSMADALTDPKLRPYRYLIVDHVEAAGRRDQNLILSQRRAEFYPGCPGQYLQGCAETASVARSGRRTVAGCQSPGFSANARLLIIAVGKMEVAEAGQAGRRPRRKRGRRGKEEKALMISRSVRKLKARQHISGPGEEHLMFNQPLPAMAGFILGLAS